jgi:hypothetical protein
MRLTFSDSCARGASGHVVAACDELSSLHVPVPRYGAARPAGLPRAQDITEGPARSLG